MEALAPNPNEQASQVQKVSAQLEASKPALEVVNINQEGLTISARPIGIGVVSQRLMPTGERSGLQTRIASP